MTEAELQSAVLECAALLGWLCVHFRPAQTSKGWRTTAEGNGAAGFPDCVLAHPSHGVLFVELKAEKGKISLEQDRWHRVLTAAGAWTEVWRPADWKSGHIEAVLRGGEKIAA